MRKHTRQHGQVHKNTNALDDTNLWKMQGPAVAILSILAHVSSFQQPRPCRHVLHGKQQQKHGSSSSAVCSTVNPIADELQGPWDDKQAVHFLETYWQKRPVLIRQAFPDITDDIRLLTEADFFALSLDDDVESRTLVRDDDDNWTKEYGPFERKYLRKLSSNRNDWTMLIQEVDRHIPSVADIWQKYFDFIPSWRRDDVMVSYAAPGGGIGAHVDSYDVFLIQGRGKREWAIENSFVTAEEELAREVPNVDTRLLTGFVADQVWQLNAGDVLYLPPRVPHRGVSLGENCTTVSMGFRSPTHRSMVTALCDYICQNTIPEKLMYSDPSLQLQSSSGFIGDDARIHLQTDLQSHVRQCLDDKSTFDYWLGKYLTVPLRMQLRKPRAFFLADNVRRSLRSAFVEYGLSSEVLDSLGTTSSQCSSYENDEDDEFDEDEDDIEPVSLRAPYRVASKRVFADPAAVLDALVRKEIVLRRAEGAKIAFIETTMFVDGEAYSFPKGCTALGPLLCDSRVVSLGRFERLGVDAGPTSRDSVMVKFILALIHTGYYYPVNTDVSD